MDKEALKRVLVGPIATVGTPFDVNFEVDYGKMAELTKWWVESGLVRGSAVIKVAAAMGEGPQLRDHEWQALLRTTVQAANDKATVMCGLHYKDTVRQIEDAKRAQDLGAVAVQVSPPVHNGPTQSDVLHFYEDLSNAINIGIMIYNTRGMLGENITLPNYKHLSQLDNVVAIKWQAPEGINYEEIFTLKDQVNIIDNSKNPILNHKLGGHGYINWTADIYPPIDLQLWSLLEDKQYEQAQTLWDSVFLPLREFHEKIQSESGGQARLKKGMMAVMGRPIGHSRPPSLPLSRDQIKELRAILIEFGWPVA